MDPLAPGTLLGQRYRIDSSLGRDRIGDVYRALDTVTQTPVTLKVLADELTEEPEFLRRFQRSAAALARLDHPGITHLHGLGQEGPLAYLVAEYVPGVTLRRRMMSAGGPLPLQEATGIFYQLADALDYAHLNGLVDGDVRPSNIVLADDGRALLANCGILPALANAMASLTWYGAPAYLSPEHLLGRNLDARSDVYSLGTVLYEMVTGRRPFLGETGAGATAAERLTDEQLNHAPLDPRELNPALPVAAAEAILRALAKEPGARWPSMGSFAAAWDHAVGARLWPPQAATAAGGQPVPVARPARKPGKAWVASSALLLIVLGLLALGLWLGLGRSALLAQRLDPAAWARGTFAPPASATAPAVGGLRGVPPVATSIVGRLLGPAPTARPAATAGPSRAYAIVQSPSNVRAGPGTDYAVVDGLAPGTQVSIIGRNSAGDWLWISDLNGTGWISASLVQEAGALEKVPVVVAPTLTVTETPPPEPTATPTEAPSPTATSLPTATPAPTATPTVACASAPDGQFANPFPGSDAVGCPASSAISTHYSHQYFEHGQMIYRYDVGSIYVLYADGTWQVFPDTYRTGESDQLNSFSPPPGLLQPIRGFDRVWERPEVRSRLGWATRGEMGLIPGQAEDFGRGTALWLSHAAYFTRYFVLFADGRWIQS